MCSVWCPYILLHCNMYCLSVARENRGISYFKFWLEFIFLSKLALCCPSWWPNISVSVNFQTHVLLWFLITMKLSFKQALTDHFLTTLKFFEPERLPFWILPGREADFSSLMPNWYFFSMIPVTASTQILNHVQSQKKGTSPHPICMINMEVKGRKKKILRVHDKLRRNLQGQNLNLRGVRSS